MTGIATGADTGVPHDATLTAWVKVLLSRDEHELPAARSALRDAVGDEAYVDASGVAAHFTMMVRIADATGIPLDPVLELTSRGLRRKIGADRFDGAKPDGKLTAVLGRFLEPFAPYLIRMPKILRGLMR